MEKDKYSTPVSLAKIEITDDFWKSKMELVRKEIIPYQWEALNDRVEGAEPSFCMHNFKVAAKQNKKRKEQGKAFEEPEYTFRGFQVLPENMGNLEDKFHGFIFQDSDFYKWIEAVGYSLALTIRIKSWSSRQMMRLTLFVQHSRKMVIWIHIILLMEKI